MFGKVGFLFYRTGGQIKTTSRELLLGRINVINALIFFSFEHYISSFSTELGAIKKRISRVLLLGGIDTWPINKSLIFSPTFRDWVGARREWNGPEWAELLIKTNAKISGM